MSEIIFAQVLTILVKKLKDIGMKVSILSGDSKQNCLNTAQALDLTKGGFDGGHVYMITSTHEDKIAGSTRRIMEHIHEDIKKLNQEEMKIANEELSKSEETNELDFLRKKLLNNNEMDDKDWQDNDGNIVEDFEIDPKGFKNLTKRTIVLRGDALEVIMNSKYLLSQFKSILLFCQSIVGYSMQPSHKSTIVRLLKQQKEVVLAIGDGFNDIGMIREADIGVQISNLDVPVIFSDVVISSISLLEPLIFNKARGINKNITAGIWLFSWVSFTQVSFYYIFYSFSSYFSDLFMWETMIAKIAFLLIIIFLCLTDTPYKLQLIETFPVIYREHEILRKYFSVIFVGIIIVSIFEVMIVSISFTYFVASTYSSSGQTYGVELFEKFLVTLSCTSACSKIGMLRADNSRTFPVFLMFMVILVWLVELYLVSRRGVVDDFDFSVLLKEPMIVANWLICLLVPFCLNWCCVQLFKYHLSVPLSSHLQTVKKKVGTFQVQKDAKKASTETLKTYYKDMLLEFLELKKHSKFRVTSLIKQLIAVNNKLGTLAAINRTVSIDLFNYQIGLHRFTNYINERVERRRFSSYLMMMTSKYAKVQFVFYFVCFAISLAIGINTDMFNCNYMLDTNIPYILVCLIFMAIASRGSKFEPHLHTIFIIFGSFILLTSLVLSSFSLNRFELNLVDMYSTRIWFTLILDMIGSSILVIAQLLIKVISVLIRFDSPDPILDLKVGVELKVLLSYIVYYLYLLMLKYKVDCLITIE